jgi:O-antigen/teichoic acid export membrane protein
MREALKRLTGESVVYGLGQVSGRFVQFLMVPVLTRVLTRDVYGVGDLVMAYAQSVVLLLVFGMDAALVRFFYHEPDREARRRMVTSSLLFRVGSALAGAVALAALAAPLAPALMGSAVYRKYLMIGAVTLPFTLLALFMNDVLRVTFQPWKFIGLNLTQALVTFVAALWLVVQRHMGVAGVLYAKLAGDAVASLLGLALIRLSVTRAFDPQVLKRMLRFGAPIVPAAFCYGIIGAADRFFLQRTRGLDEVGTYAVAVKFFAVAMMGVSAFSLAFFPFAHARSGEPDSPRLYARVFSLYMAAAGFLGILVGGFAPEVVAWAVPAEYRDAARPALLLTFAAVAYGAYYVSCLGIQLSLKTAWLGGTAALAAVVAVTANAILVPRQGPMGAAEATWLGNVVLAVGTYRVAQTVHPLPFRGGTIAALYALALALGIGAQHLPSTAVGAALKLAIAAAFLGVAWAVGVGRER